MNDHLPFWTLANLPFLRPSRIPGYPCEISYVLLVSAYDSSLGLFTSSFFNTNGTKWLTLLALKTMHGISFTGIMMPFDILTHVILFFFKAFNNGVSIMIPSLAHRIKEIHLETHYLLLMRTSSSTTQPPYSKLRDRANCQIVSDMCEALNRLWLKKCGHCSLMGMLMQECSMMMKEDIEPSMEMSTTPITMMKRTKRCIRQVLSISLFPAETALTPYSDTNRTIARRTNHYSPDHDFYSNRHYLDIVETFSLPYIYNGLTN